MSVHARSASVPSHGSRDGHLPVSTATFRDFCVWLRSHRTTSGVSDQSGGTHFMKTFASMAISVIVALTVLSAPAPANAAPPYPGTVATSISYAQSRVFYRNQNARVAYRVNTAGNGSPRGWVTLRVYRIVNNRYRFVRQITSGNNGTSLRIVSLGRFGATGRYATLVRFTPVPKSSVYKASTNGPRAFRVLNR